MRLVSRSLAPITMALPTAPRPRQLRALGFRHVLALAADVRLIGLYRAGEHVTVAGLPPFAETMGQIPRRLSA